MKQVCQKRIRDRGYRDYGLDKKRIKEIIAWCRKPEAHALVMRAAQEANPVIADHLATSLINKWSHEMLLAHGHWMCYGKTDFYVYRRHMVFILDGLLKAGKADI